MEILGIPTFAMGQVYSKISLENVSVCVTTKTNLPAEMLDGLTKSIYTQTPFTQRIESFKHHGYLISNLNNTFLIFNLNDLYEQKIYKSNYGVFDIAKGVIDSIENNLNDWAYFYGTCINSYSKMNELTLKSKLKKLKDIVLEQ